MNIVNKIKGVILQELSALQKEQTFENCHYNRTYCDGVKHGLKLARKAVENMSFASLLKADKDDCGTWEEIKDGDGLFNYHFRCTKCGGETPSGAYPVAPDFCPCCGNKKI